MKLALVPTVLLGILAPHASALSTLEDDQTSSTNWYLINADTDEFVKYISDGEVIDHATVGTNLNICVDSLGEASVEMTINGMAYPHHNFAPFCLAAVEAGPQQTFDAVSEFTTTGTYTIAATPYPEDEKGGTPGATKTITISFVDSRVAPENVGSVSGWYLVNAATEQFLKYISNGDRIDLSQVGTELNLCVNTQGDVASVLMTLNGAPFPYHNRPPFCLAADESHPTASFESVAEFRVPGTYTITATPYTEDELQGVAGTMNQITLILVNSAFLPAETSSPTVSPTTLQPTREPTRQPTSSPTPAPSTAPTLSPTQQPTSQPTPLEANMPLDQPSSSPSVEPSAMPSVSMVPSAQPSSAPSSEPTISMMPSLEPSSSPSVSMMPSSPPSSLPSSAPSSTPSGTPSASPTSVPSLMPSSLPSNMPSSAPSSTPSSFPSASPTNVPSLTSQPTPSPTGFAAAETLSPTEKPTPQPTKAPTGSPTLSPTLQPTQRPTKSPTGAPGLPEELVGSITGWYLVNAASNTFIKYISNGEAIDHNMYGKDLNLCVDTKGDVGSVQMTINGRQSGYHNRAPFCLAADESRPTATFEGVPELAEYGTYSIVATPYFGDELQGEVGISESIIVAVIDSGASSSAPSPSPVDFEGTGVGVISKWYLVNAATNSFVRYITMGEVIYQSIDGTSLNICVDTLGDVASVEMSLNGQAFPHHNIPPFCLAADEAGPPQTYDAVSELASTGTFSVTATPYSEDDLGGIAGATQRVLFSITNAPGRIRGRY